ncbi:hypothetical protein HU200_001236 [Digitaria exilis]|uniref:Uncharacterized protein n=1 Tax=Digitaria exilis TaxID=1010633 RepID=A0A835FZ04_9POAL|nr:hypothetical protein HU200_001236 [Digitaria exilis]
MLPPSRGHRLAVERWA